MDDLVKQVTERAGISDDQARKAIEVVIDQLKERLPGPVAGQLDSALGGGGGGAADALKGLGGKLGL